MVLEGEVTVTAEHELTKLQYEKLSPEEQLLLLPSPSNEGCKIQKKLIVKLGPGQFFGERALKAEEPRAATVTTSKYTDVLVVKKESYRKILMCVDGEIYRAFILYYTPIPRHRGYA